MSLIISFRRAQRPTLSIYSVTECVTVPWSSLIAYGVLGTVEITRRILDLHRADEADLATNNVCERTSASIPERTRSVSRDFHKDVHRLKIDEEPGLCVVLNDDNLCHEFAIASTDFVFPSDDAANDAEEKSMTNRNVKHTWCLRARTRQ